MWRRDTILCNLYVTMSIVKYCLKIWLQKFQEHVRKHQLDEIEAREIQNFLD